MTEKTFVRQIPFSEFANFSANLPKFVLFFCKDTNNNKNVAIVQKIL